MRCRLRFMLCCVLAVPVADAQVPAMQGRWQGTIDVPGRPLRVTLDMDLDAGRAWRGSVIVPGLAIAGAPLRDVDVQGSDLRFSIAGALDSERTGPTTVTAKLDSAGTLRGTLVQAGNRAPLVLTRVGAAQVQLPPASTPVRSELVGEWIGQYEMGGYPRDVTIAFENVAGKGATASFLIVGKQRNVIPVDLVVEDGEFVRIESNAFRVVYEARLRSDTKELVGTLTLGGPELALTLRRAAGGKP